MLCYASTECFATYCLTCSSRRVRFSGPFEMSLAWSGVYGKGCRAIVRHPVLWRAECRGVFLSGTGQAASRSVLSLCCSTPKASWPKYLKTGGKSEVCLTTLRCDNSLQELGRTQQHECGFPTPPKEPCGCGWCSQIVSRDDCYLLWPERFPIQGWLRWRLAFCIPSSGRL